MKKCPYCAEEIQDEAILCRYCGRDLTKPIQQKVKTTSPRQPKKKQKKSGGNTVVIVILSLVGICCLGSIFMYVLGQFTLDSIEATVESESSNNTQSSISTQLPKGTPKATATRKPTATRIPTATPSPITMDDIADNYDNLTDLQWEDYVKALPGLRVHWIASVREVQEDGDIFLDVGQDWFEWIYLEDIPKDVAKSLNKGQVIEFEATVRKVSTFFALTVRLNNPTLISTR